MKQYHLLYGGIGGLIFVALGLLGIYNTVDGFGVGCLLSLVIPLVVGALAARAAGAMPNSAGEKKGTGQLALEGGIAAGIAGLVGGLINTIISYIQVNSAVAEVGGLGEFGGGFVSLLLTGVVIIAIVYFVLGVLGGVVMAAMSNA